MTKLGAEEEFAVDQLYCEVCVGSERGEPRQHVLGAASFAGPKATQHLRTCLAELKFRISENRALGKHGRIPWRKFLGTNGVASAHHFPKSERTALVARMQQLELN